MDELKRQIIEALTFPRLQAFEVLDLEKCPSGGRFHSKNDNCKACEAMFPCAWIESNEPFIELAAKSTEDLLQALRIARDFIVSGNHRGTIGRTSCVCEHCRWIGRADRLIRAGEGKSRIVIS